MCVCLFVYIGMILFGELVIFLFDLTCWSSFGDAECFETACDSGGEVGEMFEDYE